MRNCNYIGNPPMFHSRVSGVGTPVARLNDGTETVFNPAGLLYRFQSTPVDLVMVDGVPTMVQRPPEGPVSMYELQVTVKNYVPGSGQVTYTTWGRGLYPGFNPTPNWKTVSETEFISMYPDWVAVRNRKFGMTSPAPTPPSSGSGGMGPIIDQMLRDVRDDRISKPTPVPPKTPPPVMLPAPAPTTGTGSALPLVIGAALLLLS